MSGAAFVLGNLWAISYHGTVVEKDDECIEIRKTCQRNSNG